MLTIDVEREQGGRWIGEVTALPGVMVYGTTEAEVRQKATTATNGPYKRRSDLDIGQ
jgi:predicted RNase H-like HicB family nuclease